MPEARQHFRGAAAQLHKNSQWVGLHEQCLYKIKPAKHPAWVGEGLRKPHPYLSAVGTGWLLGWWRRKGSSFLQGNDHGEATQAPLDGPTLCTYCQC